MQTVAFATPEVLVTHSQHRHGGIVTITGPTQEAVQARADAEAQRYASSEEGTHLIGPRNLEDGSWIYLIRWYR